MAESLIIRLGSQYSDVIHWLITSADKQEIIASGELADASYLSDLSEKSTTRKVTVLVPACDVALKQLNVPSKSTRAIKQAVPYMLEEELAEDVDKLFFAYANIKNQETDANCFVAVLDDNQMQLWLSWLSDASIKTSRIVPDALSLPLMEDKYTAIELNGQVIVRQNVWQAMALDANLWQLISNQWQVENSVKIANFSTLPLSNDSVELFSQPQDLPLFIFAQHSDNCPINLLQDRYVQKEKSSVFWQHWRLAASLFVVALLINFSMKIAELNQLDNQLDDVQSQITAVYQDTFTENKTKAVKFNKIKSLINFKLRSIGQGNSETFIPLINKIIPAFTMVDTLKPDTLKYDQKRNEIRIQAVASNYQDFERFKSELEKVNLEVSQGSQNNQGNQVVGSFSIKDKS